MSPSAALHVAGDGGLQHWPLADVVAGYGTRAEFDTRRPEDGQWVFWDDRVELVLAGRYDEVKPLHVELAPTYLCNFSCPWCSCRAAREEWGEEDVFTHPRSSPLTVMSPSHLDVVVRRLAEHQIGIMWVGGEPTMSPALYPAVRLAHSLGLQQCLFTNGSPLDEARIRVLLDAKLVFVRVSLDAVTDTVHEEFHGYMPGRPYSVRVKRNIETLATLRRELDSPTLIGVSVVVDRRNFDDLLPTAEYLADVCRRLGRGSLDYVIFRPAYQFYGSDVELEPGMAERVLSVVGSGGQVCEMLEAAGIRVILPAASFQTSSAEADTSALSLEGPCRSCGWFGEVTPSGQMVLCSDQYGNPEYFIGDISQASVNTISKSDRRLRVLEMTGAVSCMSTRCPRNGRGFHLNKLFAQIERLRSIGRLDDVRRWIEDLRRVLPRPTHSFFL